MATVLAILVSCLAVAIWTCVALFGPIVYETWGKAEVLVAGIFAINLSAALWIIRFFVFPQPKPREKRKPVLPKDGAENYSNQ